MEIDCVMVWTTIGSAADGHKLASVLVAERLAACVNVMGEMDSVYRWQGQVETERERQVIMKTTADPVPALEGTPARTSRLRSPRIHRHSHHRGQRTRTCNGSGSPRLGDIIRRIPALWIAAIALKLLVWLTAPDQARARSRGQLCAHRSRRSLGVPAHDAGALRNPVAGQPEADPFLHPGRRRSDSAAGHVFAAGFPPDLLRHQFLSSCRAA